jgi:predicted small lipoprotein YifL
MARLTLMLLILITTLSGCGQKGPLYFPDDEDEREEQQDGND